MYDYRQQAGDCDLRLLHLQLPDVVTGKGGLLALQTQHAQPGEAATARGARSAEAFGDTVEDDRQKHHGHAALEAEADVQAAAAAPVAAVEATPATAAPAPEILERLDRIDAQLAALSAVIGTPPGLTEPSAAATVVAEPAPEAAAAPAPDPVEAAVAEAAAPEPATPEWRDEVSYTLNSGEGIEVKLSMEEGQTARFFWTANGSVVNFDLHGDGSGESIIYEQGRAVPEASGDLTAAFTGNHGWFWRNRTEAPVTVTLRTGGDYAEIKAP